VRASRVIFRGNDGAFPSRDGIGKPRFDGRLFFEGTP